MNERVIMAGFGGQGIMLMGQLLTYAGMYDGKEVIWLPSYGPEMRGGTANCAVTISDLPISTPIITRATSAIVMNNPSLEKFENTIIPGGSLFINSSLVDLEAKRDDIDIYRIDANTMAEQMGAPKSFNMLMLGAYLGVNPAVSLDSLEKAMENMLTGSKAKFIASNMLALKAGVDFVGKSAVR